MSYKRAIRAALKRGPAIIGRDRRDRPIYAIAGGAPDADTAIEILEELRGKDAADLKDSTPDELRGKTPEELSQFLEVLDAHLRSLHQTDEGELRDKTPDEQKAFAYGLKLRDKIVTRLEDHRATLEVFRRRPAAVERVYQNIQHGLDGSAGDVRRLTNAEVRDRALRVLNDRSANAHLSDEQKAQVERQVRRLGSDTAKRLIVTENDDYREAWMKAVTHPQGPAMWTEDERRAMQAYNEYRAMAENVTTAGGFGIPVLIDPSIILTSQETDNPFLTLARQVDINTNVWRGVSSAGVTWAFQTEAATVADNSPTIAQPTVTVHMARGFIPFSIEVGQDYPSFAEEMSALLAAGYDELLVDKFTRGSGSGEPQGILTALSANTNVRVRVQTSGAFGATEPYRVWNALPQKYRRAASWLMSVDVNSAVRQLGTANVFHAFTENLKAEWLSILFNKGAFESPYMPNTTTSTSATDGLAIVGDFENFLVARRAGMNVELVPHIFDITANRPTGQRGWFAYARIGSGSVNDLGFRLLVNT